MRIHEGKYAYDLEQPPDPRTQLRQHWTFKVYRLQPVEQVLASGQAATRAEAEKKAKAMIAKLQAKEERPAA